MKLIAFCGRKQSGKDSMGSFLLANAKQLFPGQRVKRFAFADTLKEIAIHMYGVPREHAYGSDEQKNMLVPHLGITTRECLERLGFGMRQVWDGVFVTRTLNLIDSHAPDVAVITDLRASNEVDMVKSKGGKVVRLKGGKQSDAPIENELRDDDTRFDAVIEWQPLADVQLNVLAYLVKWGWVANV